MRFRHAGGVGAESDCEAVVGEGPSGEVRDGFLDRLLDVVAEHFFEVELGVEIAEGQGGEFVMPVAVRGEDIGDGELAIAVEPPEETRVAGERMGGASAVATIDEADINEAIISGFDGIETVDCAGGVDGSVKGGVLIFRINPDGEFRRPSSLLRYSTQRRQD